MTWDTYAKYYDWEFEQRCTDQKADIDRWLQLANRFGGPVEY